VKVFFMLASDLEIFDLDLLYTSSYGQLSTQI
jgi:hypothetical protein